MNSSLLVLLIASLLLAVGAQYGQPAPEYQVPALSDNYVCSFQGNYGLLGQLGKHNRPTVNFCQNAYKVNSCDKCCKMAARIQGTKVNETDIIGFNIVLKRQPLCICCAPNTF